jgi:hypothetical protein
MFQIPDWLIPILQQFPIVALVLGALWVVLRWVDGRQKSELDRLNAEVQTARTRADAEIDRVRKDKENADREHAAELERMNEMYTKQITKLQTRIRELEKKLGTEMNHDRVLDCSSLHVAMRGSRDCVLGSAF